MLFIQVPITLAKYEGKLRETYVATGDVRSECAVTRKEEAAILDTRNLRKLPEEKRILN